MNENQETSKATSEATLPEVSGSATPFLDELLEIENMHNEASHRADNLLRSRGWEHTSDTPGCIWQWVKKLPDGRTAMVSRERAIDIETELCGEHYQDFGG